MKRLFGSGINQWSKKIIMEQEILQLLGKLALWILSGMGGAYILVQFWGQKWIETKFLKDLEAFKAQNLHELSLLMTRKVKWNEIEHDVLSTSWKKLTHAHGKLKFAISAFREVPNLDRMNENEFQAFLAGSDLTKDEKEYMSSQTNKATAYVKVLDARALHDAHKAFSDFHGYIEDNRIFLSPDVKGKFLEVDDYLWKAWVSQKMSFHEYTKTDFNMKAYDTVSQKIKPLIDEIELLLQKKLFPEPNKQEIIATPSQAAVC